MTTFKTGTDLVNEAKARITEISVADAIEASSGRVVFLDVREPNEWNLGHLPEALHIARGQLESKIEAAVERSSPVIIYCATGNRSALAADTLQQMGYGDVKSLAGGFRAWAESGGEIED